MAGCRWRVWRSTHRDSTAFLAELEHAIEMTREELLKLGILPVQPAAR